MTFASRYVYVSSCVWPFDEFVFVLALFPWLTTQIASYCISFQFNSAVALHQGNGGRIYDANIYVMTLFENAKKAQANAFNLNVTKINTDTTNRRIKICEMEKRN